MYADMMSGSPLSSFAPRRAIRKDEAVAQSEISLWCPYGNVRSKYDTSVHHAPARI